MVHRAYKRLLLIAGLLAAGTGILNPPVIAQTETPDETPDETPCGVVDAIRYPVDSVETVTIPEGYDDFGISRGQFGSHHTGFDLAFYEQGAPIYAAARGRVSYASIQGWNDERGVVVLEHVFPDGNVYYTVYGHIEETDDWSLPEAGTCVEMGDIIGAIGWPLSSSPHLHYEIRRIIPNEGGPGYVDDNPLAEGWYHPLDFTQLWQLRLSPAFVDYVSLDTASSVPPAWLKNGGAAFANSNSVLVTALHDGGSLWQVNMDTVVNKIAALPDDRVVARSRSGLTVVVAGGRYSAAWTVAGPDVPFILLDETLFFATDGGGAAAYTLAGETVWTILPGTAAAGDVDYFGTNGATLGLVVETADGELWRVLDVTGTVHYEAVFEAVSLVAPVLGDGWVWLADGELRRLRSTVDTVVGAVDADLGRAARLTADMHGNSYLFLGDAEHTLLSWDSAATLRWQTTLPVFSPPHYAPLLAVDGECLLYTLDADGRLYVFDARTGDLIAQTGLYAGGDRNRRPGARLLSVEANGYVHFSAGYLSLVTLNGRILGADVFATCPLG